jgi:hypothetical protein
MGALSVVICAILSGIFLKERLSFVGKVGCFNCIVGSVIIALSAPEQSSVASIQDMKKWVIAPGFLSFAGVIVVACTIIALYFGPKYGKRSMMVYLTVCSLIGGLSVVATQGLGAAVVAQASGSHGGQFKEWFLYVLLVFVVVTLLTEIIYLNVSTKLSLVILEADNHTESTESFQRCVGHANVLRLLHLIYHRHLCSAFSGFQGNANPDYHGHYGFLDNLLRCRSSATFKISQRCPRCRCFQRRSRSSTNGCRTGRARVRASSRCYPWWQCHSAFT